jgi:hypothetical protein
MRRVRRNIELLIPRLEAIEYHFGAGLLDQFDAEERENVRRAVPVFAPPLPDVEERIAEMEAQAGPLPISLRAFFAEVGTVNLVGGFLERVTADVIGPEDSGLTFDVSSRELHHGLDPLFVYSIDMTTQMWQDWERRRTSRGQATQPYNLPIGPDYNDKYGMSGAGVYSIAIPCLAADGPVRIEWHHTTFVNYLRMCLQYGGLPGLERAAITPTKLLAFLTEGFLPI